MKFILVLAMLAFGLGGCAQRSVLTDYDPNYDFSSISAIQITTEVHEDLSPSSRHIKSLVESALKSSDVIVSTDALITLRVKSLTEERPNDQAVTIGLGSGSRSGGSSIGIGTSMKIPVGSDTADYQVIQLDLIENEQVIWTASDSAKIRVKDGKGLHQVQEKLVSRLLKNFPLIAAEQ